MAYSLAAAIEKTDLKLVQIYARNADKARKLAHVYGCSHTDSLKSLAKADLYIMAVSDKAIESVSEQMNIDSNSVVAHTAGSVPIKQLSPKIKNRAVIYTLQTLSMERSVDLRNVPIFIEGLTDHARACARLFAEHISDNVTELESVQRAKIHLAAVFSCNFVNHMYTIGERLAAQANLPFDILKPLIMETAQKAIESSSPATVQTGPAIRNDYQTKSNHCEMLIQQPELKTMYINLSNSIWETSKKI